MNRRLEIRTLLTALTLLAALAVWLCTPRTSGFREVSYPTPNIGEGRNDVRGIVLHHTSGHHDIRQALDALCSPQSEASSHVVIDKNGTRYILAEPEAITWHAGYSALNGRERCNDFTIGIEFQGNTLERPLTQAQVNSAIEYILPLMQRYGIDIDSIVTHEQIRQNWMRQHPDLAERRGVMPKVDITAEEHRRFVEALKLRLGK